MAKEKVAEFEVEEVIAAGMAKPKCKCTSESIGTCHY
jgi:hypothetical protein